MSPDSTALEAPIAAPKSLASVIDCWPSLAIFAADIAVSYGRAKAWRRRDSIPLEHVAAIVAAARRRGLTCITADLIATLAAGDRLPSADVALLQPSIEGEQS